MVLYARKVAVRRAERGGLGSGRLHVRLVALFSVISVVPTVLVAIFASVLFQSGLEFWFSNRARNMLENTVEVAKASYGNTKSDRVSAETLAPGGNLAEYSAGLPNRRPAFPRGLRPAAGATTVACTKLLIFAYGSDKRVRSSAWSVRTTDNSSGSIPPSRIAELERSRRSNRSADRLGP